MSYNCDTLKIKRLENFRLPVASLFKHERKDWHPTRTDIDGRARFAVMESCVIEGRIDGEWLLVDHFDCTSEGSGTSWSWIFEPAFRDSLGQFEAVRIWEGGDSIDRIMVSDGTITKQPVDL